VNDHSAIDAETEAESIAIIGLAGRFPGAPDVSRFWTNLLAGVESISHFTDAELEDQFDAATRAHPNFVRARGVLDDIDMFDAGFFGMLAREAELTDPQHRVFLECCWEALEEAGYDPATYRGAIGVFAGASLPTYFMRHVMADRAAIDRFTSDYQVGSYPQLLGMLPDFLATRVAYKLDLRGPAINVQSACSTSLVAIAQACQSLLMYQADMVLAGGVAISLPQKRGAMHQEGGMVSGDGHVRSFDAAAGGTVFGSGAGVVLLKRLSDAIADGDHVHAVILGAAVNNDGSGKIGFTAPGVEGQSSVIAAAQAMAGVEPASIGYVECHGTATPLGDPIEFTALRDAFGGTSAGRQYCAIGSVKTNVGHLDIAAGVTGLIKTALSLKHGKLPATLHFQAPNPQIDLADSPFYVNAELADWPALPGPRRAGVSAFGVGGTNAHVVLQEAPPAPSRVEGGPRQLLVLSARSEAALGQVRARLADHLAAYPDVPLADVAFTLAVGRRCFMHRAAVTVSSVADAITRLGTPLAIAGVARAEAPPVVFMFPGQGAQHPGMAHELFVNEPVFRQAFSTCARILQGPLGVDLCALLRASADDQAAAAQLRDTVLAQPAIFAVEYALARLWMGWGIQPTAMIGHSVGEFVAACLAGVLSLEDALALVAARGRLLQDLPGGAMLALRLPEAELSPLLETTPDVALAAINSRALCVAAGPFEAIAALEQSLQARGVQCRRLHTSHAFHSAMMDPAIGPLTERVRAVKLNPPRIPYVSCVTGTWITSEEATSPDYWGRHCRATVRFADGLAVVSQAGSPILLEVGPGRALSMLAAQGAPKGSLVIASLADAQGGQSDLDCLFDALGRLWVAGVRPDWMAVHATSPRRRASLPTYPFERARHWIDRKPAMAQMLDAEPEPKPDMSNMDQIRPTPAPASAAVRDDTSRQARLQQGVIAILEELSGEDLAAVDPGSSFLELGFDSLLLGQFSQQLQNRFGVTIAFRELLGDLPTIAALLERLLAELPPDPEPVAVIPAVTTAAPVAMSVMARPAGDAGAAPGSVIERVIREQLQAMQALAERPAAALSAGGTLVAPIAAPVAVPATALMPVARPAAAAGVPSAELPSRINVARHSAAASNAEAMTPAQRHHIDALIERYQRRTAGSKSFTAKHRPRLADPRAASGFRAEWKEIVYPIVVSHAKGSHLRDVDGNDYIDLVNGFGQTALGHSPDFVTEAVRRQLDVGFPIGPQSTLAGDVAEMFCEMVGHERATFCNTGSEAVMAAMRIARTVTGRKRIVTFAGDYHGQFDEVLIKGVRNGPPRALPAAPGVPADSVSNMVVLPYGEPESLVWIRENANDLAAVVIEPVQSRHPELRPAEWVRELREITAASGTAFVVDEVVTGFRVHQGGMQAIWGVRGDMATYGKVVGGGMPVGILAGTGRFMDALDGGLWQYGDDSIPEVAPTFFAGTFVRHPLVLAACDAVLRHLKAEGPQLQERLAERTAALVARINGDLAERGLAMRAESYSSWFYLNLAGEGRFAGLLWHHLRDRGIHVQESYPCFLTTAHSDDDLERIAMAFRDSFDAMLADGLLTPSAVAAPTAAVATVAEIPALLTDVIEAPLTEPQTEVWLSAQLGDAASCAFNEGVRISFEGKLDHVALDGALRDVIARHDALRASFGVTGERMLVLPSLDLDIPVIDLSGDPATLEALIFEDAALPFDLTAGPLVRARLVKLGETSHVLLFTAHHIVCDGWSINVIADELASRYAARTGAKREVLGAVLPYSTYARQQAAASATDLAKVEDFWLRQFAQPAPTLELPTDRPRPSRKSFRGATCHVDIDATLYNAVKKAGAKQGCTLFVTLLGAFQILMGRLAGQQDVVVGIPSAGQTLVDGGVLVGHCVNLLPLRAQWTDETTLPAMLQSVRRTLLDAYEHQGYTFGTLVRKLDLPREPGRVPLVEVQFNLERLGGSQELPGLRMALAATPKRFVNFDMFVNVVESAAGLAIDIDYSTDLFDAATITRWMRHYRTLLEAIVARAEMPVERLPLLSAAERDAVLVGVNRTQVSFMGAQTIDGLIAEQTQRTPDALAVICAGEHWTYRELDARANRIAHHMRRHVAGSGGRIGILMDRSATMLASLLAVMKAGHAYVPLDPANPPERLRRILQSADVSAVIVSGDVPLDGLPERVPVLRTDLDAAAIAGEPDAALPAAPSDRSAYVIYTSGSTGLPKGVEVAHPAVANLLQSMRHAPGFTAGDVLLSVTTISFDIAGLELYLPLICGGRVVIATRDECADGMALRDLLDQHKVTVMQATPSLWRIMLEAGFAAGAGVRMLCGGEALSRGVADRLLAGGGELWNMYGPTETTIWSATGPIGAGTEPVSVGGPIANTRVYVLDRHDQPVPFGVPGELHIAGSGLARGYFGQPDLTRAAFRDLIIEGAADGRMYRTGDRALLQPDGQLQVLGRLDSQVKLRGFRIELGEIDAGLARLPELAAAAVVLQQDAGGHAQLVCYYVDRPGEAVPPAALKRALATHVPDYMVPAAWVRMDALPMTSNGKIDRKALPRQAAPTVIDNAASHVAPRTPLERTLAAIWSDVLGRAAGMIGVEDDLFSLGADSIQVFQIAARMAKASIPLAARDLMRLPTIAGLAAAVQAPETAPAAKSSAPSLRQFARGGSRDLNKNLAG
jgi:amino acid adenylation domain-containing protein